MGEVIIHYIRKSNMERNESQQTFSKKFHSLLATIGLEKQKLKKMRTSLLFFLTTYIFTINVESRKLRSKLNEENLHHEQQTDSAPVPFFFRTLLKTQHTFFFSKAPQE